MSAVLTLYCVALLPRVPQIPIIWLFSGRLEHSLARIMDPSHAKGKQSWKETRIAARASSVAAPLLSTKIDFKSFATSVQTDGQVLWPAATAHKSDSMAYLECIVSTWCTDGIRRDCGDVR